MTIQDYINLSQTSVSDYFANFMPILVNILAAVVAVVIGITIGWVLKRVVEEVSKAIGLERTLGGLSFYNAITKSHEENDITTLIGETARWSAIIVFLFAAVGSLQIEGSEAVFSQIFAYIPNVVIASLYLFFGFVVAWFVHRVILAVAVVTGNTPAHLLANATYLSIVIFAALQALGTLGIGAEIIRLLVIASIAAGALAFGLAGKDAASDLVKRFMSKAK